MGLGVIETKVHCHGMSYVKVPIGLGGETSNHLLMWIKICCAESRADIMWNTDLSTSLLQMFLQEGVGMWCCYIAFSKVVSPCTI